MGMEQIKYHGIEKLFEQLSRKELQLATPTRPAKAESNSPKPSQNSSYGLKYAIATPSLPTRDRLSFFIGNARANLEAFLEKPITNTAEFLAEWNGAVNGCSDPLIEGLMEYFDHRNPTIYDKLFTKFMLQSKCEEGYFGDASRFQS